MKVFLKTLLLTVTVFFNFSAINCSGIHKEGPSGQRARSRSPPKIKLEKQNSPEPHPHSQRASSPDVEKIVFEYLHRDIEFTFRRRPDIIIPIECKVLGPHHGVPDLEYKKHHNFITRAIIIDKDKKCVAYIAERVGSEELLGVKTPPTPLTFFSQGHPGLLNPDESKWFITYDGYDIEVKQDPASGEELDMRLPRNNLRPDEIYVRRHGIKIEFVLFAGLRFLLYRSSDDRVVGAEIDEFAYMRPELYTETI